MRGGVPSGLDGCAGAPARLAGHAGRRLPLCCWWCCCRCKQDVAAERSTKIEVAPNYLQICLKRFMVRARPLSPCFCFALADWQAGPGHSLPSLPAIPSQDLAEPPCPHNCARR